MAVNSAAFGDDEAPMPMSSYSGASPAPAPSHHFDNRSVRHHSATQGDDDEDDDVTVNVGDLGDVNDLDDGDDENLQRAQYASLPVHDDDSDLLHDDLSDDNNQQTTHRQQFTSALAQLPRPKDDDQDSGFDYFYGSPAASPRATASSTALIVASTDSSSVAPMIGPVMKGVGANANKTKRVSNRNAFTGLSNQGATCYMNSLLQTMFMTPELRLGLYRWTCTDDADESDDDNIPLQLQKLFAKLQLSTQESISTKALTKSFGWTGADVFQQHDVQELCRVLFDALEKSFKGTVNETLVNDLYQGTMKDYVQCRSCKYESSRQDEFLDLSLVIRPFGSTKMMKSVEEAIEFFLKPEVLNGDNQWMCDRCQTKRDAIKGLKFSKLPYLLSLQLKRFDYDYMTDSRVKLHDQVTFPKYLDMNSYLHEEGGGGARGKIARKMSMERHELEARGGDATATERTRRMSSMDETQPVMAFTGDESLPAASTNHSGATVADTWSAGFDVDALIDKSGPYVYELYSVLIHSGSAMGGHYYAFIKSFETDTWYDFNDSTVSELSETEVKKAWGGNGSSGGNGYGGRISYSTCAYMLMYRLVSREKNVNVTPKDSIPKELVERMHEEEERLRRQELERIEMTKKMQLKFYMKTNSRNKIEKSLHIYKTATLNEALAIAHEAFAKELQGAMPAIANTRLRMYNDYTGLVSDSYEGREDKTLQQLQMYSSYQLYLEAKKDSEEWDAYESSKLHLYVRRFNRNDDETVTVPSATEPDLSARYVQVHEDSTVESFLHELVSKFDVPAGKKIRLLRKAGSSYTSTPVKVLNMDESMETLQLRLRNDLHLVNGTEIYFEECDDLSAPSIAEQLFEREVNTIEVTVWHHERVAETIRIDRRETVRTLKNKIAAKLALPVDKFKILRGNHRAGIEIKTIDTTLFALSIGQGSAITALEGTPLSTGEYLFRLMLLKPAAIESTKKQPSTDEPTLTVTSKTSDDEKDLFDIDEVQIRTNCDEGELEFVASIKVGEEMQVDDIRQLAYATLKANGKLGPDDNGAITPAQIRLRDVQTTTLMRILVDGHTLRKASTAPVYEGRGLVAEIRRQPEHIEAGHHLMHVVYVDRSKWRFCKRRRFELVVPKAHVGEDPSTDDEEDDPAFMDASALAISTASGGSRPSKSTPSQPPSAWIPDQIAMRLTIPPEQARFAVFAIDRDNFDIGEIFKTDFDTWDRCMAGLRDRQHNYQLLVFVADADVPTSGFSARERSSISDFLIRKRDEHAKAASDKSYSNYSSSYRKPKEAALVIRTKASKSGDKKGGGGSTASSTGQSASGASTSNNGVSIRTPTATKTAMASSDTDEEDDEDASVSLYD